MALTLEVKVYEVDDPFTVDGRIEVTGINQTLVTDNVNQALQLVRNDIQRILAGPPEKDNDSN